MRKPLGVSTYCLRNLRQILPAFVVVTFSVLIVVAVVSALRGTRDGAMVYTGEFRHLTVAFPKKQSGVTETFRASVADHEGIDRVMVARNCLLRLRTLVAHMPFVIRGLDERDIPYYLKRVRVSLKEGHLPQPGTNEVAVHELLLRSNGYVIGDEFGTDVNDDDWMLGRFRIVGVLQGDAPCGVASQEFLRENYFMADRLFSRLLVFAKPGRAAEVNAWLHKRGDVKAWDYERSRRIVIDAYERILLIVNAVCVLLVLVIAIVVGLLQNIFFSQRMDEFALLLAVGHPRSRVVRKALLENVVILSAAWLAGIVLALGILWGFDHWVLTPVALNIPILQPLPIAGSLILPVVALVFCGWTVVARLSGLDPVLIIERRR